MDVEKILAQLRGEHDLIERAIAKIENLTRKGKRGRGRLLSLVTDGKENETKPASEP
jgi:hypothetical protein